MAEFRITGSPYGQPYLLTPYGTITDAGSIKAGYNDPAPISNQSGYTNIYDKLTIVDTSPTNTGYTTYGPTQKATLNLSPSSRITTEANPTYTSVPGGVPCFVSYNAYNPSSSGSYIWGRHMLFNGTYPNGGSITPSYASTPWDAPIISWVKHGEIINQGPSFFFNTTSDHRLKENITPVENGLDYILALRPRRFTWKTSGEQSIGFIAHEIQEDVPEDLSRTVVSGEKDESLISVNLYMNDELMLDENGNALVREKPNEIESEKLKLDGITWKIISEDPIYQSIDTVTMISPLVSSVQQLKSMFDEHENRLNLIEKDVLNFEGKK